MLRGRATPVAQPHAALLDNLFRRGLPPVPAQSDWLAGLKQHPTFGNLYLGDCTWAAQANRIRISTLHAWGEEYVLPDQVIEDGFLRMTNGDKSGGLRTTDVLTHFSSTLLPFPGRQYSEILRGWVAVDETDVMKRRLGVAYFKGGSLGMRLPKVAEVLFQEGKPWDIPKGQALTGEWEPQPDDGHEVWAAAQDADGLGLITWGQPVYATNAWLDAYADEFYVCVSPLLFETDGLTPEHLDLDYLDQCMTKIKES